MAAQEIADDAAEATTLDDLTPLKALANEHRLGQNMISPPGAGYHEELGSYLHGRREDLSAAGAA